MTRTRSTKLIAVLLSLIMMLGATSIGLLSFAVGEDETTTAAEENVVLPQESLDSIENLNIKNYMHFGDSMSTGYMLGATQAEIDAFAVNIDGDFNMSFPKGNITTTTHDWSFPYTYGSYPSLIAEAFGLDNSQWYSFAREGLTTNDVHRILDPSYYDRMDDQAKRNSDQAFNTLFGSAAQGQQELANMQALAQQMLPKADLITIGMGPNDIIFSPLFDVLFVLKDAAAGNTLYAQLVGNALRTVTASISDFNVAAAYSTVTGVAEVIGALPEVMSALMLSIVRGYMAVQQNWEGVVNYIRQYNQHAAIVCVGGYNATKDLQFADIEIADAILDALFQEEGTNTLPVSSLI